LVAEAEIGVDGGEVVLVDGDGAFVARLVVPAGALGEVRAVSLERVGEGLVVVGPSGIAFGFPVVLEVGFEGDGRYAEAWKTGSLDAAETGGS
jgi:hypothetical protein